MILFNLLLSTALLITTPDASGEYKKVQIPPTTHHAVKLAKKQSTVKPIEKPEPNTLAFDGVKLHVGELVAGNLFVDRGPNLQNYINQGFIGQAWHALNNNDGLVTYMAGHNPGVMSPLAAYVAVGKSVQVTDARVCLYRCLRNAYGCATKRRQSSSCRLHILSHGRSRRHRYSVL